MQGTPHLAHAPLGPNPSPGPGKSREHGPGAQIGKYTVVRRLARGGMAEVYLAREANFGGGVDRLVALKLILPHMADEARFLSMFKAEVRVAATLDHPNVAQVLDAGECDGEPYLAMEYVHGHTVQALLRGAVERGVEIPLGCAIALVIGACAGLHYAHERRDLTGAPLMIVHRDVSPSNLMCRNDGAIKLLDFGIAKATSQTSATQTGIFKGKSGYMSPEQCSDEPLDRRSDVFNLGILLYELTTARRAFYGDNPVAVINKIANARFTPPCQVSADYPPELEAIVRRAMAVGPDLRWPTAEALQLALEDFVRARKLDVSSTALAALMRAVFGDEPYPSIPTVLRTEVAPLPSVTTVDDDASRAQTVARGPHPTRRWPVAVLAAGVLGIVGVIAATWGDRGAVARDVPTPAVEARGIESPAPPGALPPSALSPSALSPHQSSAPEPTPVIAPTTLTEPPTRTDSPAPRTRARRPAKPKKPPETPRKGPKGMYP